MPEIVFWGAAVYSWHWLLSQPTSLSAQTSYHIMTLAEINHEILVFQIMLISAVSVGIIAVLYNLLSK